MSFKARRLTEGAVESFRWQAVGAPGHPAIPTPQQEAELHARAAAIERDAFAQGYAQGERAGLEAAATRAEGMLRRLAQTVEELAQLRGEILRRSEIQTVQLVVAIAERIVQRELTVDRDLLVHVARTALARIGEHGSATIRLHPEDFAAVSAGAIAASPSLKVTADPVVPRGGCLVQSDFGFMEISPEAQFRELTRALLPGAEPIPVEADVTHGIVLK
jgi:flagellar assembly protein FliH